MSGPERSSSRLPPGPRAPRLWQTLQYLARPMPYFEECHRRYGDLFTLRLVGSGTWVFLAAPDLARALFTAPPGLFETGAMNLSVWGALAGSGTLFTFDDARHIERRRLLLPVFHGERLASYVTAMREVAESVARSWDPARPLRIAKAMQEMTLRTLLRVGFGLGLHASDSSLLRLLSRVADEVLGSSLLLMPALQLDWGRLSPWGRMLALLGELDRELLAEIRRRRATGERGDDVLSYLLDVRDADERPLEDRDVRDELMTMLMAGHDTTETELTWAFSLILSHPQVLEQIREEVDRVTGGAPIERGHLPELPYLGAVISESMRLRPIAPHVAFRRLTRPYAIRGYEIPAGTIVSNAVHLLHRRADVYADPLDFRPERFDASKPDPYAWAPFGGGSRRCIGMTFALWEMKVILATVLRSTDLELVRPRIERERSGFFVVARDGLPARVAPRLGGPGELSSSARPRPASPAEVGVAAG